LSFRFDVDALHEIAYVTVHGPVDLHSSLRACFELAAQKNFDPRFRVLADLRDCQYVPNLREIRRLAANLGYMKSFYLNRVAVVLPDALWRAGRITSLLVRIRGLAMGVFSSVDEAAAWLGAGDAMLAATPEALEPLRSRASG
jgi:hypothetical protein